MVTVGSYGIQYTFLVDHLFNFVAAEGIISFCTWHSNNFKIDKQNI